MPRNISKTELAKWHLFYMSYIPKKCRIYVRILTILLVTAICVRVFRKVTF